VHLEHLEQLEHLECSLQPNPPGCFTKKLSEARGNGIGFAVTVISGVAGVLRSWVGVAA
jgi:hypothetical protein